MKNKPYFTRKNLIAISLAFIYGLILVFTGLCIDAEHNFISKKNPINELAQGMKFKEITAGLGGFLVLILVAVYIAVFVGAIIYEIRYAKVNNKKLYSPSMILSYIITLLACALLSVGLGLALQSPLTKEALYNIFAFLLQCLLLGSLIYVGLFLVIGGLLMLVVNFLLVDKPFKFFGKENEIPEFPEEEDDDTDISGSFDAEGDLNGNVGGGAGGSGGGAGGGGGGAGDSNVQLAEELDDREKVFPTLSAVDVKYDGYAIENVETDDLTLEELCEKFRNYLAKDEGLFFDIDTIRIFISGFAASHFMILEGLSGTGKSSLPRYFAKFSNSNVLFVPVQATWRDKTNILGYFNDFSKIYSETDFLVRLYESNYNPDRLHFFVLDEMNISRVEYYFADFLSTLEFPEEEWKLRVMQLPYNFVPPAKLENGNVSILNNAYFVGTANKDDSTFSIADKVYDRAITIDFDNRNEPFEVSVETSRINLSKTKLHELYDQALSNKDLAMTKDDHKKFQIVTNYIYEEFDLTFGNRILTQIDTLVPVFMACGGKKEDALDFLLSRKVIVKLEGRFEEYVKPALKRLINLIEKTYGPDVFKRSEKEINKLIRKL
ncbi:MAG: hypothetical protein IJD46_02750 [Bacilli bacterium]|nr:hypothetical protein [Bacilli bacterium]